MGDVEDYDFTTGDAGASHVFNMEAGQIRVGGYVVQYCVDSIFSRAWLTAL